MAASTKRITLGSGLLYFAEYDGQTLPDVETICVESNNIGYVQGGATVTYSPEYYEAKDDMGYVTKTTVTGEEVTLKSGVMTWNATTLNKLCETGRVTEDSSKKRRTLKIGGAANATGKNYVVCFHHPDAAEGDKWVMIVGRNQSGFEFAFAKDKETVIDAEIKAVPMDGDGTLLQYIEADDSIGA